MPEQQRAINATKAWLQDVVIGHNFCPFAKKEFERKSIVYAVSETQSNADALQVLLDQIELLQQKSDLETTLLIFTRGFRGFEHYLDLLEMANGMIHQGGYEGIYQLASFHPDYCFEGEAHDDPANYTNRSPFPTLHILREQSLARAISKHPDAEGIPERNIQYARELGSEALSKQLEDCSNLKG